MSPLVSLDFNEVYWSLFWLKTVIFEEKQNQHCGGVALYGYHHGNLCLAELKTAPDLCAVLVSLSTRASTAGKSQFRRRKRLNEDLERKTPRLQGQERKREAGEKGLAVEVLKGMLGKGEGGGTCTCGSSD